jgi:hypothetical protein
MNCVKNIICKVYLLIAFIFLSSFEILPVTESLVLHDKKDGVVDIQSGDGRLKFQLKYTNGCYFARLEVSGKQVIDSEKGISSAVKVDGKWYSTRETSKLPIVTLDGNSVLIEQIHYGNKDFQVEESWKLTALDDAVEWQIERKTNGVGVFEDAASAEWVFSDMQIWTGAILDNGGVAWNRLLESKNMTYGSHAGKVLFWNESDDRCLEIDPIATGEQQIAARFSHNSDDTQSFVQTLSDSILETRVNLSRFLPDNQEIWKPFGINNETKTVTYRISAPGYKNRFDLGDFKGVDEDAVREILNTITRYGVIDSKLCGANGWRTGYICLHEQWFAQMAMAIQDENYTRNVSETYDHFKNYAVQPDGRMLARFKDNSGDAMKGTYTEQGFYEAQWGYLLDSQPDFVMVVAEQFHNTGDLVWVRGQKETCEAALDYMLKRDSDGDGLMEMMNQSHKDQQGSDWIDVIWAAHENALVNAEMYGAIILWAEVEEILDDTEKANHYRSAAKKLKDSFNKDIKDGGFWNPEKNWYVYWREKDNSVFGNNLVIPVNFSAVGYGLCDDMVRQEKLLTGLEVSMQKEDLFSWPLCMYSFEPHEGKSDTNFPFPNYENGDIFLSWVELGTRSYASFDSGIAMKYIGNIIEQYKKDGLAHQRYARVSQSGLGDDILAGNGMAVVGLYRNIFGIQPQYNRLYLEPHLTKELNNTTVKYNLRGTDYNINLKTNQYQVSANNYTISSNQAFGLNTNPKQIEYFESKSNSPKLSFETDGKADLQVNILEKNEKGLPGWILQSQKTQRVKQTVFGLEAGVKYHVFADQDMIEEMIANASGSLSFSFDLESGQKNKITLLPATSGDKKE